MNVAETGFLPASENPFASEYVDSVPYLFVTENRQHHLSRLAALNYHAAITGPRGTGKTTLLDHTAQWLTSVAAGPVSRVCISRCPDQHARLVTDLVDQKRRGCILLVDGMERLSLANRYRLLASRRSGRGGLLVTRHRRGILPTWIHCAGSSPVLSYVLDHLVEDLDSQLRREADERLQANGGNVRDVLRYLYDQYAAGRG